MRNELQKAIATLERRKDYLSECLKETINPWEEANKKEIGALDTALSALRDALKRTEGCAYCAEYPDAYYQSDDKRRFVELCGDTLTVDLFSDATHIHVDFCPWCGRQLPTEVAGPTVSKTERVEEGDNGEC